MTSFGPPDNDYTWAAIASDTARKIYDGTFRGGDALPRASHMAREWGCTDKTVINAYKALCAKGIASYYGRRYYAGKLEPPRLPGDENTTFLDVDEVARACGRSRKAVFRYIASGKLESKKVGKHRRVYRDSVKRLLGYLGSRGRVAVLPHGRRTCTRSRA